MSQDPTENSGHPQDPDHTLDCDATIGSESKNEFPFPHGTPTAIGPYQIIRRLGEGGMGEVLLAQQTEPIKRMVALKIIKPGMDTRAVVARFELERQTLALMNHPGIARVFDAGQTDQGRPYFVMEYVEGVPINDYCDARQLTTHQRLDLMTEVCAGVQHAHQKAIIHRDLKPGNILITEIDGSPVPKIIDFGIARATEQREVERTMFTQLGHVIGTPAYMSPEQTDPTNTDIDTRTDIYSLGVVLYELLSGLTPFDTESVYSAGYDAIMKFVREQEAPRPSVRLRQHTTQTAGIGVQHKTDTNKLIHTLQGDLDWILLKALDKDRSQRYETANALAMDIRRYLTNEPVMASPPSTAYLVRKFVRRHRGGVMIGAVTANVLIAFALTTSWQNQVISHERDRAQLASAKATAVNDFLREMLVAVDPWASGDHDLTIVEAMDTARADVDSIFADQPLVAAELHATMGQTYLGLEKLTEAEEEARQGLEMRTTLLGPDHPDLIPSWLALANILRLNQQLDDAIPAGQEGVRLGELHLASDNLDMLLGYKNLAELYIDSRRFTEADSVLQIMENIVTGSGADLWSHTAAMLNLRGRIAAEDREELAAADSLFQASVSTLREFVPKSPLLQVYLNNTAVNQMIMQDYDRAKVTYGESLALLEEMFGTDHPQYAVVLENLGGIAYRQKKYEDCFANLERVRGIRSRKMGENHPAVMRTMLNMATVASSMGSPDRAIKIFEEVLPKMVTVNGEIHLDTATTVRNMGLALQRAGRLDEAEAAIERARPIYLELFSARHHQVARLEQDFAQLRVTQERWQEAEVIARKSMEILEETVGRDDVRTTSAAARLVKIYEKLGREEDAARYREYGEKSGE